MKYAFFVVFFVAVFGSLVISRARSGEPVTAAPRSADELYSKNCASCHGRDGRSKTLKGKLNHARNLSDPEWQNRVSDERIFNSIMNGKGKMPPYAKKLSEQEIDSLVPYVRGLKK
jgi:mono/diheme cytochrome c family protein